MSKQDRQGVRTPTDLERKYNLGNLGKSFAEVMGQSNDTRDLVARIESELRSEYEQKFTSLTRDTERIIMAALESYVNSSDQEEFSQNVQSELAVMADRITMTFNSVLEQVTNVDGSLQELLEELNQHFVFSSNGLTIMAGESSIMLNLQNDLVQFMKDGQQFGWWDGVSFHTGNIYIGVDEIAQFGNYAFVPYEDEETDGLDFVRVGE